MVPTEVNDTLAFLKQKEARIHFGKHFLHSLATGAEINVVMINYPDIASIGEAVGALICKGYKLTSVSPLGYHFQVNTWTLEMRVKKKIYVTDFDYVVYDPKSQKLYTAGYVLEGKKLEAFKSKTCKLVIDPYRHITDEEVWRERQEGLLHYANKSWKILDRDGDEVEFLIQGSDFEYLDPKVKWTARGKVITPPKEDLSHENFVRELDQLLVKYGMKPAVTPK